MRAHPDPPVGGNGEELAHRLRGGNVAALDAWYRSEHPRVYRLCLGFLADPDAAEDLAQDAMLHLKDHLPNWDARRPYEPWRTTVVLNLCRDRRRRLQARAAAEERTAELPAAAPSPEDAAHRSEVLALLTAALAALPEREREAFVLHDLEGIETATAAAALGIGESSVRSLLTLARRRLRQILGPRLAVEEGGLSHG